MNFFLLIIGMMLVTYLPRFIPFVTLHVLKIPKPIKEFLSYIPVTALGALLFPGILDAVPSNPLLGIVCVCSAFLIAWVSEGMVPPILGCVGMAWFGISVF